jgi:hypothetical protein
MSNSIINQINFIHINYDDNKENNINFAAGTKRMENKEMNDN